MCRITLTLSNCLKREKQSEVACLEAELAALKAKYEEEHEARLKAEAENNLMKDVLNLKPDTKRFTVKEMAIIALALCKKAGILPSNKKNIATLFSANQGDRSLICSPKMRIEKRKSAASVSLFLLSRLTLGMVEKGDKIKKGAPPSSQTFVNLKSNTMKNTMQRYNNSLKLPIVLRIF